MEQVKLSVLVQLCVEDFIGGTELSQLSQLYRRRR
jgi:hypothetical protein